MKSSTTRTNIVQALSLLREGLEFVIPKLDAEEALSLSARWDWLQQKMGEAFEGWHARELSPALDLSAEPDGSDLWDGAPATPIEDEAADALRDAWLRVKWTPDAVAHIPPWSMTVGSEQRAWRTIAERVATAVAARDAAENERNRLQEERDEAVVRAAGAEAELIEAHRLLSGAGLGECALKDGIERALSQMSDANDAARPFTEGEVEAIVQRIGVALYESDDIEQPSYVAKTILLDALNNRGATPAAKPPVEAQRAAGPRCLCGSSKADHPHKGCEGFVPRGGRVCPDCLIATYRTDGEALCGDCEDKRTRRT